MDQKHGIRSPGQARHLFLSMTDFLLNDCWPQLATASAAPPSASSSVVMATLVAAVMQRLL